MRWTPQQLLDYTRRTAKSQPQPTSAGVELEIPLHEDIMRHCNAQWPQWKYIRARSDKKSGIGEGVQDFTIFLPGGRLCCIECKSRDGKRDRDQNAWAKQMEMLGHTVYLVRSMEDFFAVIK